MSLAQNPLTVFNQFGYKEVRKTADGHSVGDCPFCGKAEHFSINTDSANKVWDCKRCGKAGGFQKFLLQIVEKAFENPDYSPLENDRGISAETFRLARVGVVNNTYIIPVFSWDGKLIVNIKIYDGESFKNTSGCTAAMYGLWLLPRKETEYDTVYVCEGEWDALTMMEILRETKEKTSFVIGVPGAGTFKSECAQ